MNYIAYITEHPVYACFPSRSFFLRLFTSFCLSTQSFFPLLSSYPFLAAFTATLSSLRVPSLSLDRRLLSLSLSLHCTLFRGVTLFLPNRPSPCSLTSFLFFSIFICPCSVAAFPSWHLLLVYTLSFLARSFVRSIVYIIFRFFNLFYLFLTCIFISDLFFFHSHFISLVFFLSYFLTLSLLHVGFFLFSPLTNFSFYRILLLGFVLFSLSHFSFPTHIISFSLSRSTSSLSLFFITLSSSHRRSLSLFCSTVYSFLLSLFNVSFSTYMFSLSLSIYLSLALTLDYTPTMASGQRV